MYLEGYNMTEIAEALGSTSKTVCIDLQQVRALWTAEGLINMDERKDIELGKIDRLEEMALDAWYRSCQDKETIHSRIEKALRSIEKKGTPKDGGGRDRNALPPKATLIPVKVIEETQRTGQAGDERFLGRIAWCIEMRLKVLGLLKEGKQAVNVFNINWDEIYQPPNNRDDEDTIEAKILSVVDHSHTTNGDQ